MHYMINNVMPYAQNTRRCRHVTMVSMVMPVELMSKSTVSEYQSDHANAVLHHHITWRKKQQAKEPQYPRDNTKIRLYNTQNSYVIMLQGLVFLYRGTNALITQRRCGVICCLCYGLDEPHFRRHPHAQ